MAYAFDDDDPEALVRQAEIDAANTMAELERAEARNAAAQAATDAANARAAGIARRDPSVYNPDRPSTWNAPDSPRRTTLDAARDISPSAEATSMAQAARAAALGGDDDASLRSAAEASIRARSDAAGRALETPAEELAAARVAGARDDFGAVFDATGRRIDVASRNLAHPSTMKYVGTMLGDGQVRQAVGPDGQPMFETRIVEEPILDPQGRTMMDPMNPSGPPLTRRVEKQVPVMEQNTGLLGEERQAALRVQEAELDREMTNTSLLAEQAMEQRRLLNEMQAAHMVRQQRAEAKRKTMEDAYKAEQMASREFNAADDIDPDRGWGEKGVGAKIAAVIASALLGFAGRDPFAHINAVIENSIDAQKANLAKKRASVEDARGRHAAAVTAYEQIRAENIDEAVGDDAIRVAALEAIKSQAIAKLQNAGVKVMTAQQQQFLNGLDQQIAERRAGIELKAATTPEVFHSSVSPYTPEQRELLRKQGESALRTMEKGGEQAIGLVGERQGQERGIAGDIKKEAAKRASGDEISDSDAKLLLAHSDNVKYAKAVIDQIDRIFKDYGQGDLPGRGLSSATDRVFRPNETARFNAMVKDSTDTFGRLVSGAAIKDEEMDRFLESVRAGVGDESLSQNLRDMQQKSIDILQNSERALPERLRAHFRRVDQEALPGLHSDVTGATGRISRPGGEGGAVRVDE